MWTEKFQRFKLDLERQKNQRSNCQYPLDHTKSKKIPEKDLLLLHWLFQTFVCGITRNCGIFLKRWEYQTTFTCLLRKVDAGQKQQLEQDLKQWTSYKLGKEYIKAVYCYCAYLTYMQSTSCEMLGWMKHKLESRLPGEISITWDMQVTLSLCQKVKRN